MKEITVTVSDKTYNRLLRLAALDRNEYAIALEKEEDFTEKELIQYGMSNAIDMDITSGENYWGEYNPEEDDYTHLIQKGA